MSVLAAPLPHPASGNALRPSYADVHLPPVSVGQPVTREQYPYAFAQGGRGS